MTGIIYKNDMNGTVKTEWNKMIRERDRNQRWLEDNFCDLDYAGQFLGDEMNSFHFDWDDAVSRGRIGDTWRIVIANLMASRFTLTAPAVLLFYEQLHEYYPEWVVERTICPSTKFNLELMKKDGIRPFAIESRMPVEAFDVLCLSMDLSGSPVAIPWLIKESGIPLYHADRTEDDAFVILGGSAVVNPAPHAPFCDIIFMGEGEEILPQLLAMMKKGKEQGFSRERILLDAVRRWDCLYVPRFYEERYGEDGRLTGTFPLRDDVPGRISFNRVEDLDSVFISTRPVMDFCTEPEDTTNLEIARGCEGKCSFCLGGFMTLPFRVRSSKLVRESMEKIIYETGSTSVVPVSFSTVSHPEINRISSDLIDMIGDRVRLISMRMDGFHDNPELCCFISMQKRGRIAFGVEGASQRLRDYVSKNLTEEQILDTMREVCRRRYSIIKFMMICNLPSETQADLDELYELAVKIKEVFEHETPPGGIVPRLLISWTVLKVSPHTPLQWARINDELQLSYGEFREKIRGLGFSTFVPEVTADDRMTHLFLRGDERLSGLMAFLAEKGCLSHNEPYTDDEYDMAVRYLEENGLPSPEEMFREYSRDDVFPWDFIDSPASRDYLYKRYIAMEEKKPGSEPVCTERCSGCGACTQSQREVLRAMPPRREEDRRIELHHPVRKTDFRPVRHVLVEFTYDDMHSAVIPAYWNCELRRALFHAGVVFDPDSVECFGTRERSDHLAGGLNVTSISLGKRYDDAELQRLMQEHAVNFRVLSVRGTARPLRVTSATYRMELPEGTDEDQLREEIREKMSEDKWMYGEGSLYFAPSDIRPAVRELDTEDGHLLITMGPVLTDPKKVFRYLLGLPEDEKLHQIPERIGFTYENKGVLDIAATREMRDSYARFLENEADGRDNEAAIAYVSSSLCFRQLLYLIRREYSSVSEGGRHSAYREFLLGLISYTDSAANIPLEEDPALKDLYDHLDGKQQERITHKENEDKICQ